MYRRMFVASLWLIALAALALIAAQVELVEPWATLLYLIIIPVVVQVFKVISAKTGNTPSLYIVQGLAAVVAIAAAYFAGAFLNLTPPTLDSSGNVVTFLGECLRFALLAWGPVELLYNKVLKVLMEKIGFAPA